MGAYNTIKFRRKIEFERLANAQENVKQGQLGAVASLAAATHTVAILDWVLKVLYEGVGENG